jgi:flagellar protein FlgJ
LPAAFAKVAKLMQQNPRYQDVMANTHDVNRYANAMQKAGYATDPNYADKLASVIKRVVNS